VAQETQASSATIRFNQSVPIEVTPAPFVMLESVRHLDLKALAGSKRSEVEIGYFDTGCHQLVRAVIEDGIVTAVNVDPCPEEGLEEATPELESLLKSAFRRARKSQKPFKPQPVEPFMARLRQQITIDTITCVQICIFGFCFVCCTTINPDKVFCGRRVIIHTP